MKYVALLRGINVSGQKKIKMADLKALLSKGGLEDVQTYIQSGNIVFNSTEDAQSCTSIIEQCIAKHYEFEVPTLVLPHSRLAEVISSNPYRHQEEETKKLYFCFLFDLPSQEGVDRLNQTDFKVDEYELAGDVLYTCYHNGAGKTKLDNNTIESKLKTSATSRNWNTVNKLAAM